MDKGSPAVHARGSVLQRIGSARNKEMCAPSNATITRIVEINSVEVKCGISVG